MSCLTIQVGIAFLAGLGFAILLIPINRWLAIKIGALSKAMMEQKDNRIKVSRTGAERQQDKGELVRSRKTTG